MPETTQKESRPPELDITVPTPLQPPLDQIKNDQTSHTERGVHVGMFQVFQRVDDDFEGFFPRV
jgi:hypothetical protein